jgi:hypothetical protein
MASPTQVVELRNTAPAEMTFPGGRLGLSDMAVVVDAPAGGPVTKDMIVVRGHLRLHFAQAKHSVAGGDCDRYTLRKLRPGETITIGADTDAVATPPHAATGLGLALTGPAAVPGTTPVRTRDVKDYTFVVFVRGGHSVVPGSPALVAGGEIVWIGTGTYNPLTADDQVRLIGKDETVTIKAAPDKA